MTRAYSEYLGLRLPFFLHNLITKMSKKIGISRSELVRTAIVTWMRTLPEQDLPLNLKIPVTRVLIDQQVGIITDLRYLYHARNRAKKAIRDLQIELKTGQFPSHAVSHLEKIEADIIEIVNSFDKVLMQTPLTSEFDYDPKYLVED
jgi:hypothetical protein